MFVTKTIYWPRHNASSWTRKVRSLRQLEDKSLKIAPYGVGLPRFLNLAALCISFNRILSLPTVGRAAPALGAGGSFKTSVVGRQCRLLRVVGRPSLSLIGASIVVDYFVAIRLKRPHKRATDLVGGVAGVQLGHACLVQVRWVPGGPVVSSWAAVGVMMDPMTWKIILPVGISFYTFQTLSYSVDVYRQIPPVGISWRLPRTCVLSQLHGPIGVPRGSCRKCCRSAS